MVDAYIYSVPEFFSGERIDKVICALNGELSRSAVQKLIELPESPDTDERTERLSNLINDGNFENYFPKEQEASMRMDFRLRGISLDKKIKFVPYSQFANLKSGKDNWLMTRFDLMQALIDAPIKKKCLEKEIVRRAQGGQRAWAFLKIRRLW